MWVQTMRFLRKVLNRNYVTTQAEEEKRFRENPTPKKRYRMTITIENAPGKLEKLYTYANYQTQNAWYHLKGLAGVKLQPSHTIPLEFKKISDDQYQGDFYVDGMIDEDYGYGNGICHWHLVNISAIFKATGVEDETRFSASISADELSKSYFEKNHLKRNYPKSQKIDNYLSQGQLKKELFRPDEYFTFLIEVEEFV